jgi:2,3-bisphosphoglycerate-independent phosphoglycerate mutase
MKQITALVILDGFGYRKSSDYNSVFHGNAIHFNRWLNTYPHVLLQASGTAVGLLPNMIGNSEVGHLTLGAGRIIKQPVTRIHDLITSGELFKNSELIQAFKTIAESQSTLHIMGLLSDAGVHAHEEFLYALITMASHYNLKKIVIHAILDGRDVPPASAALYLSMLEKNIQKYSNCFIGSIHGRFYAMDRDTNWDRTALSYQILTQPQQITFNSWQAALTYYYEQNITDEFVPPTQLNNQVCIQSEDTVLFFNFRPDRIRQLATALLDETIFPQWFIPIKLITATCYNPDFYSFKVRSICQPPYIENTLLDVLESAGKKIFTIAETEKYAHITYFFNGGREIKRSNETRILIPSVKNVKTYAQVPRMSADLITQAVLKNIATQASDFYLINYANADMVGHSGDYKATCLAIACLDEQLEKLYTEIVLKRNGILYITSDHGKAEDMWDYSINQPRTAHTSNPIYFLEINNHKHNNITLPLTKLSHVAPYILTQADIPVPPEMR